MKKHFYQLIIDTTLSLTYTQYIQFKIYIIKHPELNTHTLCETSSFICKQIHIILKIIKNFKKMSIYTHKLSTHKKLYPK